MTKKSVTVRDGERMKTMTVYHKEATLFEPEKVIASVNNYTATEAKDYTAVLH
jgi:hypothetical protein